MAHHKLTSATSLFLATLVFSGAAYGQGTAQGPMTWKLVEDNNRNLIQIVGPLGAQTDNQFDALSRLHVATQPLPLTTSTSRPTITIDRDGLDHPVGVTDPRHLATTYGVSGFGDTKTLTSPDTQNTTYTYDDDGNVKTATDSRAKTTTYTYDDQNRLTAVSYQTGVSSTFEWDGGTAAPKPAFSWGHLTRITDESGNTIFGYDGLGHVVSRKQTTLPGNVSLNVSYGYGSSGTANGKVQSVIYPSNARVNYTYDAAGRVQSVTVNPAKADGTGPDASVIKLADTITYSAFGQAASWNWADGRAYLRTWDAYGRPGTYPLGYASGTGAAAGSKRTLHYDDAGRISGYTHANGTGTSLVQYDQTFSYDALDRLSGATQGTSSYVYQYDDTGNRTQTRIGGAAYADVPLATSNRYNTVQTAGNTGTTTTTYGYDATGNELSNGRFTSTFSDRGRLASVTASGSTATYLYNALGQRVSTVGPTSFIPSGQLYYAYDQVGHLLGEYQAGGSPVYEVVWVGDRPIGVIRQTGAATGTVKPTAVDFVYADHLDTPRVIARASDHAIVWRWDSTEPFGVTAPNNNPNSLGAYTFRLRFPGQVQEPLSGLFYNWNRDYNPALGRYVQSDPIGLGGGVNTYAYALGLPVRMSDLTGLSPDDVQTIINTSRSTVADMTKAGTRTDPGALNDAERSLWDLTHGQLGHRYLGCYEQAAVVGSALRFKKTDDTWTFNTVGSNFPDPFNSDNSHLGPHWWVEGTSSNPSDPKVVIDPFHNVVSVIPGKK